MEVQVQGCKDGPAELLSQCVEDQQMQRGAEEVQM